MSDFSSLAPPGSRILAVDDQRENLDLLETILEAEGYRVTRAQDGAAGLRSVEAEAPDCIILDVMMPRMDGFEVCRRLKGNQRSHFIPVLMLTALSEVEHKVRGLDAGADDFLNKPILREELLMRVRSLVRIKRLRDELDTTDTIIVSMVQALESKDPLTGGHSQRVAANAVRLATRLNLAPERRELIAKSAFLHDIGKIGLPDHLLWPDGPLSRHQVAAFRRHAEMGEQILAPFLSFAGIRALVRHHHERLDGSGYPDRLAGHDFTVETEVVALANQFDELCCAYPASREAPLAALREAAEGGAFHGDLVEEFLAAAPIRPEGPSAPPLPDELTPPSVPRPKGTLLLCGGFSGHAGYLQALLADAGHSVEGAAELDALDSAIERVRPDLLLLDATSGNGTGYSLCRRLKDRAQTEFLPVILMTPPLEREDRQRCAASGADDYLPLPLHRLELLARIQSLLRLRLYFRNLEEHQSVILALAAALEAKDPYTRGHSERVGLLAARLAREMALPEEQASLLKMAGQLHDVGKIGIPDSLLNKPDRLTDEEFLQVMTHPSRGELICRPLKTVQAVLPIIRHHHERFDGSGYPDHLRGMGIPLGARILALADAYDALTSKRSYRRHLSCEEALALLVRETAAGLWDPQMTASLLQMVRRDLGG